MTSLVIGLTGGIASGKSIVAEMFAQHGVPIIDTDQLAKNLCEPERPAFHAIVAHYGKAILQGQQLDRSKLRDIIFNNPQEKQWLEQLLHPLIREQVKKFVESTDYPYCIVSIPLLAENYPYPLINRILVVDCEEKTQLERLLQRDKLPEELARKILSVQASRQKRLSIADDILPNEGSLEKLAQRVNSLHHFYLEKANNPESQNSSH